MLAQTLIGMRERLFSKGERKKKERGLFLDFDFIYIIVVFSLISLNFQDMRYVVAATLGIVRRRKERERSHERK